MRSLSPVRSVLTASIAVLVSAVHLVSTPAQSVAAPSRAELRAAQERLMELEKDFELVVERYNLVHERFQALQAKIAGARSAVDGLTRRMQAKEQTAISIATELYKSGGSVNVEAILSTESLSDLDSNLVYLEHSEAAQTEVFESLATEKGQLDRQIADLQDAKDQASKEQQRLDALRVEIEAKVADQQEEVESLNDLIERAERRAARAAAAAARRARQAAPPSTTVPRPAPAPDAGAQAAVDAALSQLGKPYQWGAAGPDTYDCSGLTMWAWAHAGVSLPHNSGMQYAATPRVQWSDIAPGDLLFFGSPIHHVGMYIGNGQMVEAPYTGSEVRVVSASRSDYVGAGRPGS